VVEGLGVGLFYDIYSPPLIRLSASCFTGTHPLLFPLSAEAKRGNDIEKFCIFIMWNY
jgi:hypothetical protein